MLKLILAIILFDFLVASQQTASESNQAITIPYKAVYLQKRMIGYGDLDSINLPVKYSLLIEQLLLRIHRQRLFKQV